MQYHFHMLGESARMQGFQEALRRVVPLGGRVVELGGGTGALSFYAAERAAKVWCVERQSDLVAKARALLDRNGRAARVEVVEADAMAFLPPEPVDVVICEMLHSALLCEQQWRVLSSFKERYLAQFGPPLPRMVPEATVLGVQPVRQDFDFFGYQAPIAVFQPPGESRRTHALGASQPYAIVQYSTATDSGLAFEGVIELEDRGELNALLFVTNNALAVLESEGASINWRNQDLVLPLAHPIEVRAGDSVRLRFSYQAGADIPDLEDALEVSLL